MTNAVQYIYIYIYIYICIFSFRIHLNYNSLVISIMQFHAINHSNTNHVFHNFLFILPLSDDKNNALSIFMLSGSI